MAKKELIDGYSLEQWEEFAQIAKQYSRPIKFTDSVSSKIALLNFYLNETLPNGKKAWQTMDRNRLISICYKLYHNRDTDGVKDYALKLLNIIV